MLWRRKIKCWCFRIFIYNFHWKYWLFISRSKQILWLKKNDKEEEKEEEKEENEKEENKEKEQNEEINKNKEKENKKKDNNNNIII